MIGARIMFWFSKHSKYAVVGTGTGGLNLITHLLRSNIPASDIRVFEPAQFHYYQPGFTMVGAGFREFLSHSKKMSELIPSGVALTTQRVSKVLPDQNKLTCDNGQEFTYDELVLASGLQLNWGKIKGAKQLLQNPNSSVGSIYEYKYAKKTALKAEELRGGKAIFTEPVMPIKCAGAPQKILYLWTDQWQKKGYSVNVEFCKSVGVMFGVPKYSQTLTETAASYGIKTTFKHSLVEVTDKEAIFENLDTKQRVSKPYDFLHITPPMSAHSYIAESGLADAAGYLDLDKYTLRHKKYRNVWGLGDCTNLPNSKTAAAAFSQTQALHDNLLAVRKNPLLTELPGRYEGYASCPLFVGRRKLMLAEFKYDGVVDETFYSNQEKPRWEFYMMKKYIFPLAYWFCVPRGLWAGRKGVRWI